MSKLNKIPANLNEVERELYALKLQKLEALENQERLKAALPHRYAQKHYPWSREFYDEDHHKLQCVTAANQIGKSTVNIKKCIEWCVNKELWPKLWPVQMGEGAVPSLFWYLYPDKVLGTAEFEDKWLPLLPGDKDHPEFGYKVWYRNRQIERIDWKSGISLHFKAYAQDNAALQGSTVWAMFCFTAGTIITTNRGQIPIEDVTTDDMALTRAGWKPVGKTLSRDAEVISVPLTNGTTLEGTPDHLIWTKNRGWVELGCLAKDDQLLQVGICQRAVSTLEKFLSLTVKPFIDTQSIKTKELGTTLELHREKISTLRYGNHLMALCRMAVSYIILTLTHLTTIQETFSALLVQTIQRSIRLLSGKIKHTTKSTSALFAESALKVEHLKKQFHNFAQINVAFASNAGACDVKNPSQLDAISPQPTVHLSAQTPSTKLPIGISNALSVDQPFQVMAPSLCTALKNVTHHASQLFIRTPVSIVRKILHALKVKQHSVQIVAPAALGEKSLKRVYCLKVTGQPEFFANGVLVHNCDEEVPVDLLSELQTRVSATDGYLHFVFTATLGQTFWRDVVERRTQWPHAKVWQISLYDCMKFEDGTPTRWTKEKIQRAIDACISPAEVQRRVFGKFVKDEGLKYQTFDRERHFVPYVKPPADWVYIGGADYGSGGKNHPSAVTIVAVSPDFTKGCVVRHWRGDNLITTSEDVVLKCVEMSRGLEIRTWYYDYSAKDLATYAQNSGLPFETAEKSHAIGEGALNTLFKSGSFVLMMPNEEYEKEVPSGEFLECYKMADEFESLAVDTNKTKAKDDSIDSCRYAIAKIQWNWEQMNDSLAARRKKPTERVYTEEERRKQYVLGDGKDAMELSIEEELDEWNQLMEV